MNTMNQIHFLTFVQMIFYPLILESKKSKGLIRIKNSL